MTDPPRPPGREAVRWSYDPAPDVPAGLRRRLAPVLAAWEIAADVAEDVLLVVTELAANVVDHARTPFEISLERMPGVLRIAVRDGSSRLPEPRDLDPAAARGRGLLVVQAVCRTWGYELHAAGARTGKTVTAELAG
ncbi:ATP-binding protein [Pseudonocardia ailaonensis]|uniref:ATP-binding protein n=1 Tax=Pseudonocardia ailaonensis TaxID=367279 RepID=A0ABN2MSX9_9PSEU